MFDIDSYFKDFMEKEEIFHERNVLRPEFVPSFLPHRDHQIQKVAEIVACTLKNSMPSNLFLFGKTGTGKTAVIKYVSEHLNQQCRESGIPESKWIFLNCQEVNTGYRVLAKICDEIDPKHPVPIAGWPIDVVFDALIEKINTLLRGNCFIVLDEIDVLVKKARKSQDVLYNLFRINSRLQSTKVNIIGISNVLNFKNELDPRVISSLGDEDIVFPAYNALEIKDILDQRAVRAFFPHALDQSVIPLCAALAAKEHGDARKALDLLRKAGECAERRNAKKVVIDHVYAAQENMEKDKMKEYFEALPLQSKMILLSLFQLEKHSKQGAVITGDIYNTYVELVKFIPGLNKLTQRRVSELIRELDLAGMVNARVKSTGRYGRTKFIKSNIDIKDLKNYLCTEPRLAEIVEIKPASLQNKTTIYAGKQFRKLM
ncbi:MAG: cell division control protein Cdc6 [Promethearchaeia archaeon]|nr:MAG: cell division control protein Cdc6 [Candidatus Lokiarchaeia archaeon]